MSEILSLAEIGKNEPDLKGLINFLKQKSYLFIQIELRSFNHTHKIKSTTRKNKTILYIPMLRRPKVTRVRPFTGMRILV